MVLGWKKKEAEPEKPKTCMEDSSGQHNWTQWQGTVHKIWKTGLGFDRTAEFTGSVVEQQRLCRTCRLREVRVDG